MNTSETVLVIINAKSITFLSSECTYSAKVLNICSVSQLLDKHDDFDILSTKNAAYKVKNIKKTITAKRLLRLWLWLCEGLWLKKRLYLTVFNNLVNYIFGFFWLCWGMSLVSSFLLVVLLPSIFSRLSQTLLSKSVSAFELFSPSLLLSSLSCCSLLLLFFLCFLISSLSIPSYAYSTLYRRCFKYIYMMCN